MIVLRYRPFSLSLSFVLILTLSQSPAASCSFSNPSPTSLDGQHVFHGTVVGYSARSGGPLFEEALVGLVVEVDESLHPRQLPQMVVVFPFYYDSSCSVLSASAPIVKERFPRGKRIWVLAHVLGFSTGVANTEPFEFEASLLEGDAVHVVVPSFSPREGQEVVFGSLHQEMLKRKEPADRWLLEHYSLFAFPRYDAYRRLAELNRTRDLRSRVKQLRDMCPNPVYYSSDSFHALLEAQLGDESTRGLLMAEHVRCKRSRDGT